MCMKEKKFQEGGALNVFGRFDFEEKNLSQKYHTIYLVLASNTYWTKNY